MLLLWLSSFPLRHDVSPPVVSMVMSKSSIIRLVKFIEFPKVPYSSTLKCVHGCLTFFNVIRMKRMMWIGEHLDA